VVASPEFTVSELMTSCSKRAGAPVSTADSSWWSTKRSSAASQYSRVPSASTLTLPVKFHRDPR